jgi:glucose/arabinose dehydrogenase
MKTTYLSYLVALLFTIKLNAQSTLTIGATVVGIDTLYTGLDVPWEILYGPDGYIWMTERKGLVSRIDPVAKTKTTILDLTGSVYYYAEAGLLGMVLDPNFITNKEVFLVYTFGGGAPNIKERLVKYTFNNGTLANPQILIDSLTGNVNHDGSRLQFMPDGTLLMTTGEAGDTSLAQKLSSRNGKILRLNTNGTVPSNNPFPGSYVYSFGHRNPQGLVLAPNGNFYISEHGPTTDDEFQLLEKGRNYGWPQVEGFCDLANEISFCNAHNVKEPLLNWTPTIAPSDVVYYTNNSFPEFNDHFIMCTLNTKKLVAIKLNASGTSSVSQTSYLAQMFGRLRDICIGPSKEIYLATNGANPGNTDPGTHSIIVLHPPLPIIGMKEGTLENNIKLYPTIIENELHIEIDDRLVSPCQMTIKDIYGSTCGEATLNSRVNSVELGNLMNGIYFLILEIDHKPVQKKVVVIR